MDTIIIILLSASILLFIVSFFQKDHTKLLEKEVEQLSMKVLQEHFLMKKRLNILEEELLLGQDIFPSPHNEVDEKPNEILKNHVLALFNQGLEIDQISKQSSLSTSTVRNIIKVHQMNLEAFRK